MKTITALTTKTLLLALLIGAATGCKKDDSNTAVTADDAADAATYAMQSSSDGLAAQVTDAVAYADDEGYNKTAGTQSLTCGVPVDTTFHFSATTNSISASYTHEWTYLLNCNNGTPESLTFSGTYSGNYDGPRLESTNTGSRNWTITGLDNSTSIPYTFNGSFSRIGSHTMRVRHQNTFDGNIVIAVNNITVDKASHRITGGSATAQINCTVSNGNSYSFTGNITFNSNHTATLVIDANTYTIDLY